MRVDEGNGNALTHGYDSTAKFLLQVARWKHDYDYGAPAGGNQLVDTCPVRVKDVPKVSSRPMDDDAVQVALAKVRAYVQRECRDGELVQLRKQRRAQRE